MYTILALLAALTLFPSRSHAAPAAPVCPGGRFIVVPEAGAPSLIGGSAGPEVIVIKGLEAASGIVETSSGCRRNLLTIKVNKRGAVVKAVWPAGGCQGESALRLKATIDPSCQMSGVIKKKKQTPRKFAAALSTCGDGTVDAVTEECEPGLGCSGGRACGTTCRCVRPTTTTVPRTFASTSTIPSTQSTVTTSTSTTSTAGQGATTSTTSTTSSTATTAPGSSCQAASAPMCGGTCDIDFVCTDSLCADPDQLCSGNEDCDSGFCVDLGAFGICAVAESCGVGDETCATGLCVSYQSCFCWNP